MKWQDRIISIDPKVMGGKPVIRGTRVPVQVIVGSLAGGMSVGKRFAKNTGSILRMSKRPSLTRRKS